jgi:thiamine pyrophosphokinase
MPNAIILANGLPPSPETLRRALDAADLFVCADGGANVARRHGLQPHAIVGDLDSADPETLRHYARVEIVRDTDTERTDTEKALDYVLARGPFDRVLLLGASAGRIDHVLGHLSLLRRHRGRGQVMMEDDFARAWVAGGSVTLDDPVGTVVSFFAVGDAAEGVTTVNLRYPLRDRRLELGAQDSISNVVEAVPARVEIARGELLFVVVKKP